MSGKPKYLSIKDDLIEKIKKGQFPDGKLPSIKKLAEEYNVSPMTANQTVQTLKDSGVVICYPDNRGTVIDRKQINFLQENKDVCNLMENIKIYARKKIKIRYFNPEYFSQSKKAWVEIIDAFQMRYPWIEIEMSPEKDLNAIIDGNDYPDVLHLTGRDVVFWSKKGLIVSLAEYIKTDENLLSQMHHKALEGTRFENELFALPVSIGFPLLFYREDILSGMPFSSVPLGERGWDDMMEITDRLADRKYKAEIRLGLWSYWYLFIGNISKEIFNAEHDHALIKSMELLKKLYHRGAYFPYGNPPALEKSFFRQKGALLFSYSSYMKGFRQFPEWRATCIPLEKAGLLTSETCVSCICEKSKNREVAWLFIRYLASKEAQAKIADDRNNFPVHSDIIREINGYPEFKGMDINASLEKSERILIDNQTLYILYGGIVGPVLESYFAGDLTASSVLDIIRPRIEEILKLYVR